MKEYPLQALSVLLPLLQILSPVIAQGQISQIGCFSSSSGMSSIGSYQFQSPGYCQTQCFSRGKAVGATTQGSDCLCGDKLPPTNSKTSGSSCNTKCQGYGSDVCGGDDTFSVFLTGISANPGSVSGSGSNSNNQDSDSNQNSDDDSDQDSTSQPAATQQTQQKTTQKAQTKSQKPSVVTKQSTIVVTAAGGQTQAQTKVVTTTETPDSKGSGPNTAGIAAGVVVGVVALCAIAGGIFFWMRHKKRKAVEEEYRQNAGMGSYNNLKPSPSSAGSMSDSRLEPSVMMQRRQSDGSIADNQDYSRRILKVTNPDHS